MDEEIIAAYRKAGKIAAQAREYAKSLVKPGVSVLEVCEKTEDKIRELGGGIAFPAQISLDDTAAHFCPDADDDTLFDKQLVCIDVGAHVDGFIGDTATTVDLSGEHENLVKASREALEKAIKIIKPGVTLGEIGRTIQETITSYGFSPVRNLSGHGLDEFEVHTWPNVPNYDNKNDTKLEEGMIIAVEPFASNGAGLIYESSNPTVFQLGGRKPVRSMMTRQVLKEINKFEDLPFCRRWLVKKFGLAKTNFALRELKNIEILREYPPLVDQAHGWVSQAEHTLLITKDGCEILTKE